MHSPLIALSLSAVLLTTTVQAVTLELGMGARVVVDGTAISLELADQRVWKGTLVERVDQPLLRAIPLGEGVVAIELTGEGTPFAAVFTRQKKERALKLVWQGTTALRGDPGERTGQAVRFDDLNGDGMAELAVGSVSQTVRICGQQTLPLLFRRVYDREKGTLRPIAGPRPGLPAVSATLEPSARAAPRKGLSAAIPLAVSRAAGGAEATLALAAPVALVDDNPATVWALPRDGAVGELVSFSLAAEVYRLTRVGIVLPAQGTRFARPRSLLLVAGGQTLRLVLPEAAQLRELWFELPAPLATNCASLVIEASTETAHTQGLALAELRFATEALDRGPAGLAADLGAPDKRREAARLLDRMGSAGAEAVDGAWHGLDDAGRALGLVVLAHTSPAAHVDRIVEGLFSDAVAVAEAAAAGLHAAGEAAVPGLLALAGKHDPRRHTALVTALAELDSAEAFGALLSLAGTGTAEERLLLRTRLSQAAKGRKPRTTALWQALTAAETAGQTEVLLDLLRACAWLDEPAEPLTALVSRLYDTLPGFANRYRLLAVMADLGCAAPTPVVEAAAGDAEPLLRAAALRALATCDQDREHKLALLTTALDDKAPLVRLAALAALEALLALPPLGPKLAALAATDSWPEVRAAAVSAVRALDARAAEPILSKASRDRAVTVRRAALDAADSLPDAALALIIAGRLGDPKELPAVRAHAASTAAERCLNATVPLLYETLQQGALPLANREAIAVAITAARALGAIGGSEAKALLIKARRRSNPGTDRAIDQALSAVDQGCRTSGE